MITKIEKLHKLKCQIAAKHYNSQCAVCLYKIDFRIKKNGDVRLIGYRKGFTFHHVFYVKDDIRHNDYNDQLAYNQDLAAEIEKNPDRFIFLCSKDHYIVTRLISMNNDRRDRLLQVVGKNKDRLMDAAGLDREGHWIE